MKEILVNATYGTTSRRRVHVTMIDAWYNPVMEEHRVRVHYTHVDAGGVLLPDQNDWMEPVDFDKVFRG